MPIALVPALNPLLSFIASGEGGYNSMNKGTQGGRIVGSTHNAASVLGKNLTDMTIAEVMGHQSSSPRRLFAAGRYQIIPETLKGILPATGLSTSDMFSQENQDRFGIALIRMHRPVRDYLDGKSNDREAALLALARVWASLPDPRTGSSYYGSGNKALHSVAEVTQALDQARAAMSSAPPAPPSETPLSTVASEAASSSSTWIGLLVVGGLAYALWRLRKART